MQENRETIWNEKKYDRLPIDQEINSIVKGYIIMKNEDYLQAKIKITIKKDHKLENIYPSTGRSEIKTSLNSYTSAALVVENSTSRRKCPNCGDIASINEVTDKNLILMDYPRIYGKKKYCGNCSYEWH